MGLVSTFLLALALQGSLDDRYREYHCDDPQNQHDMTACAAIDFERADAELNAVWAEVIAGAREMDAEIDREFDQAPTSEEVLREAQRAWIIFRDGQCAYEGHEARGGSMEPMIRNGCRARLTRERTAQLQPQGEP
jgi:uncharacterized protein YecT (DUF1311 family)